MNNVITYLSKCKQVFNWKTTNL